MDGFILGIIVLKETFFPFSCSIGGEGAQVPHLWSGVHPVGKHEAPRPHPHQHSGIPVPHVLQKFCPKTDSQGSHDRPLGHQAL